MKKTYTPLINDPLRDFSIIVYKSIDYDMIDKCRSVLTYPLQYIQIFNVIIATNTESGLSRWYVTLKNFYGIWKYPIDIFSRVGYKETMVKGLRSSCGHGSLSCSVP